MQDIATLFFLYTLVIVSQFRLTAILIRSYMKRDFGGSNEHKIYAKVMLMFVIAFFGTASLPLLDHTGFTRHAVLLICGGLFIGALGYINESVLFGRLYRILLATEIGAGITAFLQTSPWVFVGFLAVVMLASIAYAKTFPKTSSENIA